MFYISKFSIYNEGINTKLHMHYSAYQKKGNRTLHCSSAFIIQSTEIILSQAVRPGF